MSNHCLNWAMKQRLDGSSATAVLWLIADHADETGIADRLRIDYIADLTRQSRSTVQRRLKEFERLGLIKRQERQRKLGGRMHDVYLLQLDRYVDVRSPAEESGIEHHALVEIDWSQPPLNTAGGGSEAQAPGQPDTARGVTVTRGPGQSLTRGPGHTRPGVESLSYPDIESLRGRQEEKAPGQSDTPPPQSVWERFLLTSKAPPREQWPFVWEGSRAWHAWIAYRRGLGMGVPGLPTTWATIDGERRRGWFLPTLFPPNASEAAE